MTETASAADVPPPVGAPNSDANPKRAYASVKADRPLGACPVQRNGRDTMPETDVVFAGSIPALYDRYLGPIIFEPYATILAARVAGMDPRRVLETAAGTGIVTRELVRILPNDTAITATDLNQPMVDFAAGKIVAEKVSWRQADAQSLPFEDDAFDAVVCQFGVMFFPDRLAAYREVQRVLKPGGRFVFTVWDRIEENEFAELTTGAVA